MGSSLQRITSIARIGLTTALFGVCHQAAAGQLIATAACKFVMHVPGVFGGTDLHLTIQKDAVFTGGDNHKFCGPVTQAAPMGDSTGNQCFVITDGKLISGKWSNKVTSSSCILTDAAAMPPFAVADFAPWAGSGSATLHGQAFLKTVGGDVKTCAGSRVVLLPATPYVDALLAKGKAAISVQADPRLASYAKTTICDEQGNFSLAGAACTAVVRADQCYMGRTAH